jgi:uncharacterized protein YbbC (DUF1343 family)
MRTITGLEVLLENPRAYLGSMRVGLIAGASSVDAQLVSSAERLHIHPDIDLRALFGPEHGLRGEAQAGEHVTSYIDTVSGLPVYSLYGDTRKPTPEMLDHLDAVMYDLQDGGLRFYTYLSTLALMMQAAAERGIKVIVLDRPVFLGGQIMEGNLLDPAYASFVGMYPVPIRYGMTAGEMARLLNSEYGIGCDLQVVAMRNWSREMWFDHTGLLFVPPSPNLPTLSAIQLYPGTCLIEGTNLSEGRGTTKPFEYIGAPWIHAEKLARDLNQLEMRGVLFRPVYFVPTFSKHQGKPCGGVHIVVTDREQFRPVRMTLQMMAFIRQAYPDEFGWRAPWHDEGRYPIDLLAGGSAVREQIDAAIPILNLVDGWESDRQSFAAMRAPVLLYPDSLEK